MLYPKRRHKTIISKRSINLAGFQRQKESQIIKNAVETNIYCLYSFQNGKLSEGRYRNVNLPARSLFSNSSYNKCVIVWSFEQWRIYIIHGSWEKFFKLQLLRAGIFKYQSKYRCKLRRCHATIIWSHNVIIFSQEFYAARFLVWKVNLSSKKRNQQCLLASYNKQTLARRVIPTAPGYRTARLSHPDLY